MDGNTMLASNSTQARTRSGARNGESDLHEPSRAPLSVSRFGTEELDQAFHTPPRKAAERLTEEEEQLVAELLADEISYIDSPEFTKRDAFKRIYRNTPQIDRPDVSWYRPLMGDVGRKQAQTSTTSRKSSVVLSKDEERALFLKLSLIHI